MTEVTELSTLINMHYFSMPPIQLEFGLLTMVEFQRHQTLVGNGESEGWALMLLNSMILPLIQNFLISTLVAFKIMERG
jgi:hypothetical protein